MKKLLLLVVAFVPALLSAQRDTIKTKDSSHVLNSVEITGIRADIKTPVSQKTLSSQEIQNGYFGQDVPVILSQTPSVIYYSDGGAYSGYMYMRIRGIDQTRINFTFNGIPLNEPEDQGCYFSNYTDFATNIGSVQMQRGVGTSTNGTASFAGSVNFESPDLSDSSYTGIQTGYGSYNSSRMSSVFNTGILKNNMAFYGRYSHNYSDGYRYHSGTDANTFFLTGGYFGKKDIVKFTAFSGKSKNQMAYLATSESDIKNDPRTNYLSKDENDDFRQDFFQVQHTRFIGEKSFLTSSLYYTGLSGNYDVYFAPDMLNFSLFSDFYGAMSNYSYYGKNIKINAGINANSYYRNHSMSIKPMASQSLYSNRGDKSEVATFFKVSYDIKKLTVFGDLQGRVAKFSYRPNSGYAISVEPVTWKFFNPKAGITYSLSEKNNLYASVGSMHREPTRNDMFAGFDDMDTSNFSIIGNLNRVKPESVTDFELGTNINLKKLKIQADIFRMDFKNEIAAIGQLSYIGLPLRKNVASSYRQGVEIDYLWSPTKYLSFSGIACYMNARIKEYTTDYDSVTYKNVAPYMTPTIVASQTASLTFWKITTSISANYMSKAYLDNTMNDTLMMSSNLLFNASVSVKVCKNCSVSIIANNLTDVLAYNSGYAMGGTRYYYVAAGRNFFASLNLKF